VIAQNVIARINVALPALVGAVKHKEQ